MDIRQSERYADYLRKIGWQVEKIGDANVFIRKIPFLGNLIKIQRTNLSFEKIEKFAKEKKAFQVIIEPDRVVDEKKWLIKAKKFGYKPEKSPFIPTKTFFIQIAQKTENEIFEGFSKNKRRDIRLAQKNQIIIKEGTREEFIRLKKKSLLKKHIFPFGIEKEISPLCEAFNSQAKILIAYHSLSPFVPLAGALFLFWEKTCYYWQAAATSKGKKLAAPTLLLWEGIKLAKKEKCEIFDFEGVYDDRFPQNKSWLGFTKFKEGFRGDQIIYPRPIIKFFGLAKPLNFFYFFNAISIYRK